MFFLNFSVRCIRVIIIERIVISAFRAKPVSSWRPALDKLPIQNTVSMGPLIISKIDLLPQRMEHR
jgi:hypothetical protein